MLCGKLHRVMLNGLAINIYVVFWDSQTKVFAHCWKYLQLEDCGRGTCVMVLYFDTFGKFRADGRMHSEVRSLATRMQTMWALRPKCERCKYEMRTLFSQSREPNPKRFIFIWMEADPVHRMVSWEAGRPRGWEPNQIRVSTLALELFWSNYTEKCLIKFIFAAA